MRIQVSVTASLSHGKYPVSFNLPENIVKKRRVHLLGLPRFRAVKWMIMKSDRCLNGLSGWRVLSKTPANDRGIAFGDCSTVNET